MEKAGMLRRNAMKWKTRGDIENSLELKERLQRDKWRGPKEKKCEFVCNTENGY